MSDELVDLLCLCKQCLSIIDVATAKDEEIKLLINSAILDLERQGIHAKNYIDNELIRITIVMFVKARFGMVSVNEKEIAERTYKDLCTNLSLSQAYTTEEDSDE